MDIGVFSFNTEYTLRADKLARAAEERGFESLWVPEHTHIPVPLPGEPADPETGMPMAGGNLFFLPEEYRHMSDPFTSLAAAAAVTSRLKLGTCVCLLNQHHPINIAKHVATLDRLSDGRFIFGIGAGWNVAEMGHHGVAFETRWRELRERLAAVRTLWAQDKASFKGEFVEFAESWQYPKPLRPKARRWCSAPSTRRLVAPRSRVMAMAGCRSPSMSMRPPPTSPTCTGRCVSSAAILPGSKCRYFSSTMKSSQPRPWPRRARPASNARSCACR